MQGTNTISGQVTVSENPRIISNKSGGSWSLTVPTSQGDLLLNFTNEHNYKQFCEQVLSGYNGSFPNNSGSNK